MIANPEFSSNQVSTVTSTGSISEDNSSLSNDLKLRIPTSISLTPPDRDSDSETDAEAETDGSDLELETPTSISLTPPDRDSDSETDAEAETDGSDLELETPTSISLTPPDRDSDSETDAEAETDGSDLELETPTSISLTPPDRDSDSETDAEAETDGSDLKLETPTSISLTPPDRDSDSETDAEAETDGSDLELETPTSISLTPPDRDSDSETDAEAETDGSDLELETPTSISLTPPDRDSDSETDEETETDDNDLNLKIPTSISLSLPNSSNDSVIESPIPISLSVLPVELAAPETEAVILANDNTSLSVGEFTAASGGKVTVEIAIDNATDLQSLDLDIYYDTELLDIPDPIPETEINEGVSRTGIAADWQLLAESGDNPEAELANPIVNVVEDIGDGKTGKIDINLINTSGTPLSGSGKIIAIDFQVSEDVTSESIAKIDLRQAELGMNGQTFNLGDSDSLLHDGSVIVGVDSIDIDGNGVAEPLNDGIVILRHLFGAEGEGLTNGAIGSGATRTSPAEIKSYLNQIESSLDIDRNGVAEPLNDGILIVRRLFGAEGEGLTNGAIGSGATRIAPTDIASAIDNLAI